eukprot:TRINITY_DN6598_c0_g1_i1.p1 TRINITY_DN6598_c0_g1~~TRINITY_DN6598_c0_g1_i1.p1  ORF type:complete len:1022 (+),score=273.92 TRINITY_DN6598_c0_g1_i1:149-3214(+)
MEHESKLEVPTHLVPEHLLREHQIDVALPNGTSLKFSLPLASTVDKVKKHVFKQAGSLNGQNYGDFFLYLRSTGEKLSVDFQLIGTIPALLKDIKEEKPIDLDLIQYVKSVAPGKRLVSRNSFGKIAQEAADKAASKEIVVQSPRRYGSQNNNNQTRSSSQLQLTANSGSNPSQPEEKDQNVASSASKTSTLVQTSEPESSSSEHESAANTREISSPSPLPPKIREIAVPIDIRRSGITSGDEGDDEKDEEDDKKEQDGDDSSFTESETTPNVKIKFSETKPREESESEEKEKEKVNEKEVDEEEDKIEDKRERISSSSEEEKGDGNDADSEHSSAVEEKRVKAKSFKNKDTTLGPKPKLNNSSSYVIRSPIGDIVVESPYDLDTYNLPDVIKLQKWFKSCIIRKKLNRLKTDYMGSSASLVERRRNCLLREIISTEESYVNSLANLDKIFVQPLIALCDDPATQSNYPPKEEILKIFSNISTIRDMSAELLRLLKERNAQWPSVTRFGDLFQQMIPLMQVYHQYYLHYDRALQVLTSLEAKSKSFSDFLKQGYQNPDCSFVNITFYLIMPIQRMPRYQMLLSSLKSYTPEDHVDFKNVEDALEQVSLLIEEINSAKKSHLIFEKLRSFESIPEDLRNKERVALHDGYLNVIKKAKEKEKDKKHEYYFLLFSDILVQAKIINKANGQYELKRYFKLNECAVEEGDENFIVKLIYENGSRLFIFSSDSSADKANWIKYFKEITEKLDKKQKLDLIPLEGEFQLRIEVLHANDLKIADENGTSDPYVKMTLEGKTQKTKVIQKNLNPVWNEVFYFDIKSTIDDLTTLEVDLYDEDLLSDDFLGGFSLPAFFFKKCRSATRITVPLERHGHLPKVKGDVTMEFQLVPIGSSDIPEIITPASPRGSKKGGLTKLLSYNKKEKEELSSAHPIKKTSSRGFSFFGLGSKKSSDKSLVPPDSNATTQQQPIEKKPSPPPVESSPRREQSSDEEPQIITEKDLQPPPHPSDPKEKKKFMSLRRKDKKKR